MAVWFFFVALRSKLTATVTGWPTCSEPSASLPRWITVLATFVVSSTTNRPVAQPSPAGFTPEGGGATSEDTSMMPVSPTWPPASA